MNNKKIKKTIFIIILVIIISLIIFTIYSIANSNKEKNPNSELNQNIINEIENLSMEERLKLKHQIDILEDNL